MENSGNDIAFMGIKWRQNYIPELEIKVGFGTGKLIFPDGREIIPPFYMGGPGHYCEALSVYGYPSSTKPDGYNPLGMELKFEDKDSGREYMKKNSNGEPDVIGDRLFYKEIQTTIGQGGAPIYSEGGFFVIGVHNSGNAKTKVIYFL